MVAVLLAAVTEPALAAEPAISETERVIVLASRQDQVDAIDLARRFGRSVDGVRVARAKNGWFAVILPSAPAKTIAEARVSLAPRLSIPADAYLGRMDSFPDPVFAAPPSPILASGEYRIGPARSIRYGALTVTLESVGSGDGERAPAAMVRPDGAAPFRTVMPDASIDAATYSKVRIVRLDPGSGSAQAVFSFFTGGAHCCTLTRILTQNPAGGWSAVDAGSIDGEGYQFEDVASDGRVELLGVDNSFLYAFASYAESFAPPLVFRLSGGVLQDVTGEPGMRPFLRRELRLTEAFAGKDEELWHSNGFLAAWVALKARLGEVDDAWQRMLTSYDRHPALESEACSVDVALDRCPADKRRTVPFPEALRAHLAANGYPVPAVR